MWKLFMFILCILCFSCIDSDKLSFRERLQPVPKDSGFKMDNFWIWGGSLIQVDGTYHLFASRWPRDGEFPDDYRNHSEIAWATSDDPLGPYQFQEVVIGERDSAYWDSNMAHNPTIHKIGNEYVLFYIGSDFTTYREGSNYLLRKVGYAVAPSIDGPWQRSDQPIIDVESNNPAVLIEENNVKLLYRDAPLRVYLSEAADFRGPYELINDNVWPEHKIEDFYFFKMNETYHFICEDNVGGISDHERWGVQLYSENGIDNWKAYDPVVIYDHDLKYEDGSILHCTRRERPQLLIQDGDITHLLTSVYDGENSWCQPVALNPPFSTGQKGIFRIIKDWF
jgi:hypothetical protein